MGGARFSPVAFYAMKRGRSEWLSLTDQELVAMVDALRGRRWVVNFGKVPKGQQHHE
jgi:hypothetical protein